MSVEHSIRTALAQNDTADMAAYAALAQAEALLELRGELERAANALERIVEYMARREHRERATSTFVRARHGTDDV